MGRDRVYIGIDVGTGSARAGVFDAAGRMRGSATREIQLWRPQADFVEQSSEDIWRAVCAAVREAVAEAGVKPEQARGLGFDATCSLVALDGDDRPVTVSPTGRDEQNIIVWMDHRAIEQQARINAGGHEVLRYVGGGVSVEMQSPKLRWIKENLPQSWARTARFFDLPDFLTYRATGDDTRSLCSTVCKWTYLGHKGSGFGVQGSGGPLASARRGPSVDLRPPQGAAATAAFTTPSTTCKGAAEAGATESQPRAAVPHGWDETFFRQVGLGDLADEGFRRIGTRVRPMGEPVGNGLTERAARELGLRPGTPVGVSIIDAHAGGLGVIGASVEELDVDVPRGLNSAAPRPERAAISPEELERRIALIGGTSSCHMAVSREPRFIPGVWGPYYSAMVPGMWLTEGGQSATGALIDHVINSHARAAELQRQAAVSGQTVYELLNTRLAKLAELAEFPAALSRELHVLPYFHGNRSPRADATLRGMVSGLRLSDTVDDLALLYLATIQAIAYGTRHIIETLNRHGYAIDTILACGGGTKNPVFLREHADISGCTIVLPREPEAVLLGSAILGAVAAGDFGSLMEAMSALSEAGKVVRPTAGRVASYHAAKYAVFQRMYDDQMAYRMLVSR